MMLRASGWKWMPEQLARHRNATYFGLDQTALQNFKGMHNRVRIGKVPSIEWARDREGYIAFMKEIGPKPVDGRKWSVGRKEHSAGYQTGNVFWQLHVENSSDRKY